MKTLVTNHIAINAKKTKVPKLSQIEKLQNGLKTDDLSTIRYTNRCDALGGECACGKKGIVYRFFVENQQKEIFVVGSECINHFNPEVQNDIRGHEKQLKDAVRKKAKDEVQAYEENAEHDFCIGLSRQLQGLCCNPLLVNDPNIKYIDFGVITRRRQYYYDRLKVMKSILENKTT